MSDAIASHQTVRLARGRHDSPSHGVCVMELASMLAGERFTDSPRSVCPVVAAFMRTYNDAVDDTRRQDLYGFAAQSVGTAGDGRAARRRDLCRDLVESMGRTRRLGYRGRLPLRRSGVAAAIRAAKLLAQGSGGHPAALTFIAALIGSGQADLEVGAMATDANVVPRSVGRGVSASRQGR